VNLNGRYQDFRSIGAWTYGWFIDMEQTGCEITAVEAFTARAGGYSKEGAPRDLTGTIEGDVLRICYVSPVYCLNLVIFDGGDKLVNGVEGWHYEKTPE
jgi:hypothetical protein